MTLSTEFEGKIHGGSKAECITIRGKVRRFLESGSWAMAKSLIQETGSPRSSFYASHFMGCDAWGQFIRTYEGRGFGQPRYWELRKKYAC